MTLEQIKNYLEKYRIDSEESLAKHIEELKRNTIPNNEIIFPLVDMLVNEKSVLNYFFAENKKIKNPMTYLDEVLENIVKKEQQIIKDWNSDSTDNRLLVFTTLEKELASDKELHLSTRHKSKVGETHKDKKVLTTITFETTPEQCKEISKLVEELSAEKAKKEKFLVEDYPLGYKDMSKFAVVELERATLEKEELPPSNLYDNQNYRADVQNRLALAKYFRDIAFNEEKSSTYPTGKKESQIVEKEQQVIKEWESGHEKIGEKRNKNKPQISLLFKQFPKALEAVVKCSEYGHSKYKNTDTDYLNFSRVKEGSKAYADAGLRHRLEQGNDFESGLPHQFHVAWNALAELQLWIQEYE